VKLRTIEGVAAEEVDRGQLQGGAGQGAAGRLEHPRLCSKGFRVIKCVFVSGQGAAGCLEACRSRGSPDALAMTHSPAAVQLSHT
jgi:hypothetical protein